MQVSNSSLCFSVRPMGWTDEQSDGRAEHRFRPSPVQSSQVPEGELLASKPHYAVRYVGCFI